MLLHKVSRENVKLKYQLAQTQHPESQSQEEVSEKVMELEEEHEDEELKGHEENFNKRQEEVKKEMEEVDKHILERERFLEEATQRQIGLEAQLIGEMKQEYHHKIAQLEREKAQLLKQKDEVNHLPDKNKLMKSKVQELEG